MAKRAKYLVTERHEEEIINNLIKEKTSFIVKSTNYTTEIIFPNYSYLFSGSNKPNYKLFGTLAQLKSQVKNIRLPDTNEGKISYYQLDLKNFNIKNNKIDNIFNVDIKAAYATALLNKKYIDVVLYNKIMTLPKLDRLAIVGMLATKKNIYEFQDGKEINYKTEFWDGTGEARKIFFEASKTVDELLIDCRKIAGGDFLFFWVDGIYLKTENKISEICQHLTNAGFKYSKNNYTDFNFKVKENILTVNYINEEKEEKVFNLPISKKQIIHQNIKSRKPNINFYEYFCLAIRCKINNTEFISNNNLINCNINHEKNKFMKLNLFQIAMPSMFKDVSKKVGEMPAKIKITANRLENIFILSAIKENGDRQELDRGGLTLPENQKFINAIETQIKTSVADIKSIEAVFIEVSKNPDRGYTIETDVYFIDTKNNKLNEKICL